MTHRSPALPQMSRMFLTGGGLETTLGESWPQLNVLGGCCGTDHRHIRAICEACLPG